MRQFMSKLKKILKNLKVCTAEKLDNWKQCKNQWLTILWIKKLLRFAWKRFLKVLKIGIKRNNLDYGD